MTKTQSIPTEATALKGGDSITVLGQSVEVFDTLRVNRLEIEVRYLQPDGEVGSLRAANAHIFDRH